MPISKWGTGHPLTEQDKDGVNHFPRTNFKEQQVHIKMEDQTSHKVSYFDGITDAAVRGFGNLGAKGNISKVLSGKRKSYQGHTFTTIKDADWLKAINPNSSNISIAGKPKQGGTVRSALGIESEKKANVKVEEPKKVEKEPQKMVYNHVLKKHMIYLNAGGEFNTTNKAILKSVAKRVKQPKESKKDE